MKCTCEQAAREARKAALEEAAGIFDDYHTRLDRDDISRLDLGGIDAAEMVARILRALANTQEKADG